MSLSEYLRLTDTSKPCNPPDPPAITYKFPLDPFQTHAISAISCNENVLVTAKTGSGKTLVGEYQIAHSLKKGGRIFYTTPIKSLSNQKFYDLKTMFPDRVGIMTGDIKFKPDADIIIMTTEILRNLLFKQGSSTESVGITAALSLDRLDSVIFDECHYINDRERGAVWEETLILLPPQVNLVLLSATIDSPQQFASWLGDLKQKPIHLISTEYRIVPLLHGVYRGSEVLPVMDNREYFDPGMYSAWLLWRNAQKDMGDAHKEKVAQRRLGGYEDGPIQKKTQMKSYIHELNTLVERLHATNLLPALFFVFSRRDCERYAGAITSSLIDSSDAAAVRHIIKFHLHRYPDLLQLPQYHTITELLEKGIAFHHSGLIPVLKEIIEILFSRGYVKLLFATETFAVGINMPTKTVVFTGYRKYDDHVEGLRLLNTDEYIQMAGRAGRRGKDTQGLVLYLPDREPELTDDVKRMMTGKKSTFQSRMTFHYDFILKTFQKKSLRWLDILNQSYWFRRHSKLIVECEQEIHKLVDQSYITADEVETMSAFDMLKEKVRNSVNAPRRKAQQELEAWKNTHVGVRWNNLEKTLWPKFKNNMKELVALEKDLVALKTPERDVYPVLQSLEAFGFMDGNALTQLGTIATEVNEGHCILMPLFWESLNKGSLEPLTPQETLATLSVFLGENDLNNAPISSQTVSKAVDTIASIAKDCLNVEQRFHVTSPSPHYWSVGTEYVEIIWKWLHGATLTEIATEYGFFEGNLIRILTKLQSVLEEWRTIATLSKNTDVLNNLLGADELLRIGFASSESLYLTL
jgi:superfamily II RNA helicase